VGLLPNSRSDVGWSTRRPERREPPFSLRGGAKRKAAAAAAAFHSARRARGHCSPAHKLTSSTGRTLERALLWRFMFNYLESGKANSRARALSSSLQGCRTPAQVRRYVRVHLSTTNRGAILQRYRSGWLREVIPWSLVIPVEMVPLGGRWRQRLMPEVRSPWIAYTGASGVRRDGEGRPDPARGR
jgi:hypothetical protein